MLKKGEDRDPEPDPDPKEIISDSDAGGQECYGSEGSRAGKLLERTKECYSLLNFLNFCLNDH